MSLYLDEGLELPPGKRTEWLHSLSQKDANLALVVQALLDEERQLEGKGFLEGSPLQPGKELTGETVESYRLVSPIGQGGIGCVWVAERSDGRFERKAAVKFVNIALTGRITEERFKREGSILGRLTHPNIAELLSDFSSTC